MALILSAVMLASCVTTALLAAHRNWKDPGLGALSQYYETGENADPGAVSTVPDDPGGTSFGLYMFASKVGTVDDFPALPSWPWEAQMATLSLCWAVGTALPRGWPRLTAALRAQDWATAAAECEIRSEGNPGVVPRNERNRQLYLDAASERETVPPVVTDGEVRQLQAETFEALARDLLAEGYRRR